MRYSVPYWALGVELGREISLTVTTLAEEVKSGGCGFEESYSIVLFTSHSNCVCSPTSGAIFLPFLCSQQLRGRGCAMDPEFS